MKRLFLMAILAIAGCAETGPTAAQNEARGIKESLAAMNNQDQECVDKINRSPSYQLVSGHFTLDNPTAEILLDTRKPTTADVSALLDIHKALARCRARSLVNLNKAHSGLVAARATTFTEADIDFGKLLRREISWGQYGKLTVERRQRDLDRWRAANRAIGSDLKSQHASEVDERQRATRALAAWADAQRTALPTSPTYTQCMYVVAGITCTTF